MNERPCEVWYQYSFALGLVLSAYLLLFPNLCTILIADIHSRALRRDGGRFLRLVVIPLKRWSLHACTAVLVTNPENRRFAGEQLGVQASVLPDPLPMARAGPRAPSVGGSKYTAPVVFVCSFC